MQHYLYSCLLALIAHGLLARAQSGDGGGTNGFDGSNLGAAGSGADGRSNSSANLSKGAIIAIAIVVAIVVVGGVTLTVLFYLAKKRQWQVRATIRRTTTRVVRAMTPRTPHFTFPRSPRPDQQSHESKQRGAKRDRDVEKGFVSIAEQLERSSEEESTKQNGPEHKRNQSDGDKKLPKPKPTINVPGSAFEVESPLKSPLWQRILGRT